MTAEIPSASEHIEVLWIVNLKQTYWWTDTVMDIK